MTFAPVSFTLLGTLPLHHKLAHYFVVHRTGAQYIPKTVVAASRFGADASCQTARPDTFSTGIAQWALLGNPVAGRRGHAGGRAAALRPVVHHLVLRAERTLTRTKLRPVARRTIARSFSAPTKRRFGQE